MIIIIIVFVAYIFIIYIILVFLLILFQSSITILFVAQIKHVWGDAELRRGGVWSWDQMDE